MNVVIELRRIEQARRAAILKLAQRVRRESVVPLCKKYNLRFAVGGFGDWGFFTADGEWLQTSKQARARGVYLGAILRTLARSTDEPGLYGGHTELGLWLKPYMPRAWTSAMQPTGAP